MSSSGTVSLERDGKTYDGSYTVTRGMITVSTDSGTKTTQLGGMPAEVLAKLLLSELVQEGKG